VFLNVVNGADVGVIQRGSGARFPLESLEGLRIPGHILGEKFECDEAAKLGVLGFVDHAHATAAEFFDNPVVAESFADHGWILWWNLIR